MIPLIGQEGSDQYFPNYVSDSFHVEIVPENDSPSHNVLQLAWDIASPDACCILFPLILLMPHYVYLEEYGACIIWHLCYCHGIIVLNMYITIDLLESLSYHTLFYVSLGQVLWYSGN